MNSTLIALIFINCGGVLLFAISAFGNAIVFHIGWQLCSQFSQNICSGELPEAVIYISMGMMLMQPLQAWFFREQINWALFYHLTCSSMIGLLAGTYCLFYIKSPWIARSLGLCFVMVALEKVVAEAKIMAVKKQLAKTAQSNSLPVAESSPTALLDDEEPKQYALNTWSRIHLSWLAGFGSGITNGLFGTGGPPMMLFVTYTGISKNETRATLSLSFSCVTLVRSLGILFFQDTVDVYTTPMLIKFLVLSTSSLLWLAIGNWIATKINQIAFRRIIILLLMCGSTILCSFQTAEYIKGIAVVTTLLLCGAVWYCVYELELRKGSGAKNNTQYSAVYIQQSQHYISDSDSQDSTVEMTVVSSNGMEFALIDDEVPSPLQDIPL